jgi:ketosteroid isomerase-like protein
MTTRIAWHLAPALLSLTALVPLARAATDTAAIESEISRLEHVWNDAYGSNSLQKYFSYYAEDPILVFYNERTTLADYRKLWTETTKTEPVESAKMSDIEIRVGPSGDTAVASYQLEVRQRHTDGKTTVEHAFETDVWFNRKGEWRIHAVHYSTANSPPK